MKFLFVLCLIGFLLVSFYIASRICRALKRKSVAVRRGVWATVLFLDFSFFLTRLLPSGAIWLSRILYVVSTTWLVVVLYGGIALIVLHLVRIIMRNILGVNIYHTPRMVAIAGGVTLAILSLGYVTAVSPVQTNYTVSTDALPSGETIVVALVSDIHAGYSITRSDVEALVEMINETEADMVIFAGDQIDGDLAPVLQEDILRPLEGLACQMGHFVIMGNHEYVDDDSKAAEYLRSISGLTLLRDSVATVGPITIVGRDDVSFAHHEERKRKSLEEMWPDSANFVIVADHQPSGLAEARAMKADVCVSGHTHAGQVWPMRFFTDLLFDLDYGIACVGRTTAIVTCGFGTWGPRVRLGESPEVVKITLLGTSKRDDL